MSKRKLIIPRRSPVNLVAAHFEKHRTRTPFDFFWRVSLEQFILSAAVAWMVGSIGAEGRELPPLPPKVLAVMIIVIAPLLETIVFQMIPIEIMRLFKVRRWLQLTLCTAFFFSRHVIEDVASGLAAGLVGGFYLSFTYDHGRTRSWWTATWMTLGVHGLNNLLGFTPATLTDG